MLLKVVLRFFAGFCLVFCGLSEVRSQLPRFERLTVEEGFQNNIVYAVTEDKRGLMWFATATGIDRYDGYKVVHYSLPQKKGQGNNLSSQVQHIVGDVSGNIWAASASSVYLYDYEKDVFVLPSALNEAIAEGSSVTCIATSRQSGDIYVGTSAGFFQYRRREGKIVSTPYGNQYIRFIFEDSESVLWVATNKGLDRFQDNGNGISILEERYPALDEIRNEAVTDISEDLLGRFWIVTLSGKVMVFQRGTGILARPVLPVTKSRSYAIKDVFHDKINEGVTMVGLDGGGILLLDTGFVVRRNFLTNEDDPSSLSSNAVYDIDADRYGRIWVTTHGGGVNVMNPLNLPFFNFTHQINNENSLSNNAAKAVTEDRMGNLWFGTRKGISKFNPARHQWIHFNEASSTKGFTNDNVLVLTESGDDVWAGTYGGGLMRINTRTGQIKSYLSQPGDSGTLGTDFVYTVLVDREGRVWAGGIRGPLSYLDPASGRFTRFQSPQAINCLVQDSSGVIMVGSERGVYWLSGNTLVPRFPGLQSERVLHIMEYQKGEFWLATQGKGIIVVNHSGKNVRSITSKDGLPSDVIAALVKDINGDVWIGTSKGIAHLVPASGNITTYTRADGLAGSQVNYGAAYRTRAGNLIFGTTNGFSLFDPRSIKSKGFAPVIILTGLTVNNKLVSPGEQGSPLDRQLDATGKLILNHRQNSFSLDFVNTSPPVSGKHLYSWKLEGFDKEWSQPSTMPTAVYTNLNPGNYTFRIKTYGKGQTDRSGFRDLPILVMPPWWQTGWAYLGYLMLVSALAYALFGYFQNVATRKRYAERLRLNTSISHEIRTPLTLIKGPVSALSLEKGLSDEARDNLNLARKNIEKLESIITQFIDFQKSAFPNPQMTVVREDLLHLLDDVTSSFIPLMREKNIKFSYHRPSSKLECLFDRDKIEKVLNNLMSNAVKYSLPGSGIRVDARVDGRFILIAVEDSGIGIPRDQQQHIFKGYFRANNTINIKETGSGIGLSVAKELIELHHGRLHFNSEPGKGSSFICRLPVHNDALLPYLVTDGDQIAMVANAPQSDHSFKHKKILVAEDNDELRNYIDKALKSVGFSVISAADGKEALVMARKHKPDILLTDVIMPEMNGFQLCSTLKRDMETCHIPIIMLTAIHDSHYLLEGYKSGADDYVKKPFDMAYILTRIENLLENRTRFRNKVMSVFEQEKSVVEGSQDLVWLRQATQAIADNMGDPEFSVDKLGRMLAVSRPVLFRRFKAITNESPQHYIHHLRLRRALELLRQGSKTVYEVAYECGFSDPRYFSTAFKKHFGKSPTEYIQKHRD